VATLACAAFLCVAFGGGAEKHGVVSSLETDTNKDNRIDSSDLFLLLRDWHRSVSAPTPAGTSSGSQSRPASMDGSSGATGGEMKITGTLSENMNPPACSDNIIVLSFEDVIVAAIDKDGNLKIWGELSQNVTF